MIDATLVTIHGLYSSAATWDRLSAVWRADEDLEGLRVHSFGYASPKKPRLPLSTVRVPDYDDIAQVLATEYETVLKDVPNIAIVTHSQAGLILQRFLEWMLNLGKGRDLARIRTIVLLACPNGGSEYLESVRHVLGLGRHPQVGSLDVLDRRIADTQRRVLDGIVRTGGVGEHQCRIPFHVYAGSSDNIVKPASAQGAFPGASTLAGDHFSILDPTAPGNRTTEAVKLHILTDLATPRGQEGGADALPAGRATAGTSTPSGHAGSPKYVLHIGEGVQGLLIGDGGVQHNDFRRPPEAQETHGPPTPANSGHAAEPTAGEPAAGPTVTGQWRKTSSYSSGGLMQLQHNGMWYPAYTSRSPQERPPASLRIGIALACDPLSADTPATSAVRKSFLAFLGIQGVMDLIEQLTGVVGMTWRSWDERPRLNFGAVLATSDESETPAAWARLLLPQAGAARSGRDERCANLVLHIEPGGGKPSEISPATLSAWHRRFAQVLMIPAALDSFLASDLGLATLNEPAAEVAAWLTAYGNSLAELVDISSFTVVPGSQPSWFTGIALADSQGHDGSGVARDWINEMCDSMNLDGYEATVKHMGLER
jgi:hypothetical protein